MADKPSERIAGIRERRAQEIASITADASRSGEWKRAKLAKLYLSMRAEADKIIEEENTATTLRRRALEADLFGVSKLPGDPASLAISRRDACDRVAQIQSPMEAQSLLERAERSGDEVLARAIAQKACDMDWTGVGNAFQERRPHLSDALNELWQLPPAGVSTQERVTISMELQNLKPEPLRGMDDFRIQALAADEPAAPVPVGWF